MTACRIAALVLAFSATLSPLAHAQTAGETGNVAEALFRDGVSLFDAGHVHDACEKFAESFRLDPANGTLQNLALCHEREGKTASAWAEFSQLAGRAAQAEQREREQMARARAAALAPRVTRVRLVFGDASNVERVEIDQQELGRAAWTSPLPLDPGTHTFVFAAKTKKTEALSVRIAAEGQLVRVDVPMLGAQMQPPSTRLVVTDEAANNRRTVALIASGVGVVAIGAGTFFGLNAIANKKDGDARCAGHFCDAEGLALEDRAHTTATVSTIAFGIALAALGVGAYAWLTMPVRVVPEVHARGAGFTAEATW